MAKYHLNPKGEAGICRAKKTCPYGDLEKGHYSSKDEANSAYEQSMKSQMVKSHRKINNFDKSKARDKNGELLTCYHGFEVEFEDFDSSFTGKGNDSYGSGFYFTTSEGTAKGYGQGLKKVQLNITNPIVVNGSTSMSLNEFEMKQKYMIPLLKGVPDIYNQPGSDDFNPMGDYSADFWDKENWTKEELDRMIEKTAKEYFDRATIYEFEKLYEKDIEKFRKTFSELSGYDGVRVDFNDGTAHWIAWFPEQIKVLTEEDKNE